MKKLLVLLSLACWTAAALCNNPPFRVVATASIFADMAANICGSHCDIQSIVPIGSDPHSYEPTPADADLIAGADLILRNGLTFESWLDDLLRNAASEARIATITAGIVPIHSATKNSSDPHAWMDARNGLIYIDNIKNALIALDPGNSRDYEFNYGVYRQQIEDTDAYIRKKIAGIPPSQRVLITSHDAFQYYGRQYGLRLEALLGISTEMEARTSDLTRLEKIIRESSLPAVFIETTVNPRLLEQIARDNGVALGGALYADSIGEQDSPAPDYLSMLRHNTDVIAAGLSGQPLAAAEHRLTREEEKSSPLLWFLLAFFMLGSFGLVAYKLSK
jgi:ABC-type Zn uptake system ZnuABC Zn-binding protein ZnuA